MEKENIGLETVSFYCPAYSVSNTDSGTNAENVATCFFTACPGTTVTVTGCKQGCTGDPRLFLDIVYDSGSVVILDFFPSGDSTSCPSCGYLESTLTGSICYNLRITEGCVGSGSCSGQLYVTGSVSGMTSSTTPVPIASPTYYADDDYSGTTSSSSSSSGSTGASTVSSGAVAGIVISLLVICGGIIAFYRYFYHKSTPTLAGKSHTEMVTAKSPVHGQEESLSNTQRT